MKQKDIKVGDLVKIHNGSYAIEVENYKLHSGLGLSIHTFKVIEKVFSDHLSYNIGKGDVHNIFIQDITNGKVYLHSSGMVHPTIKPVKELTVAEVSEKLGYEVKIVK